MHNPILTTLLKVGSPPTGTIAGEPVVTFNDRGVHAASTSFRSNQGSSLYADCTHSHELQDPGRPIAILLQAHSRQSCREGVLQTLWRPNFLLSAMFVTSDGSFDVTSARFFAHGRHTSIGVARVETSRHVHSFRLSLSPSETVYSVQIRASV